MRTEYEPDRSLPTVFIVDDDPTDRESAARALQRVGLRNPIRSFATGAEFIRFMETVLSRMGRNERPAACAVFVDLRMPPPDGFEILSWIRLRPTLKHLQVVVLTGSVDPKDMRRAAELSADFYLPKFPSDETLTRVLDKANAASRPPRCELTH